jgi:hypothetical protein
MKALLRRFKAFCEGSVKALVRLFIKALLWVAGVAGVEDAIKGWLYRLKLQQLRLMQRQLLQALQVLQLLTVMGCRCCRC